MRLHSKLSQIVAENKYKNISLLDEKFILSDIQADICHVGVFCSSICAVVRILMEVIISGAIAIDLLHHIT